MQTSDKLNRNTWRAYFYVLLTVARMLLSQCVIFSYKIDNLNQNYSSFEFWLMLLGNYYTYQYRI